MKPNKRKRTLGTLLVHGGRSSHDTVRTLVPPIYQSASYSYEKAEDMSAVFAGRKYGHIYSRISNPTVEAMEKRLSAIEDGQGAIFCASGMSAISLVCLSILRSGDEIASATGIFGGTVSLFDKTLAPFGIKTVFFDAGTPGELNRAITERTRMIFIETIGNPHLNVPDIRAIARIAKKNGIPLVVDSTVTTPFLVRPKELGADIVVYSTTKFIAGSGTSIGGALVDCGTFDWGTGRFADLAEQKKRFGRFAFLSKSRRVFRDLGFCISPFNAYLSLVGIETLSLRMERQCANAVALAKFLRTHPKIKAVNYPGLAGNPYRAVARRQFNGRFGAILTFLLTTRDECFSFVDSLKLANNVANIGDTRTLVIHPASTIFIEFSEAERLKNGVTEAMVRVSAGIEDINDIIDDFRQALEVI